jgi:hypothetical protein
VDTSAVLIATMQHRRSALEQALTRVGWQLAVHHDVAAALAHLRTKPYAAVFCDEHLRGASANGFLAWSRRLAPEVPFYVVATTGDAPASAPSTAPMVWSRSRRSTPTCRDRSTPACGTCRQRPRATCRSQGGPAWCGSRT